MKTAVKKAPVQKRKPAPKKVSAPKKVTAPKKEKAVKNDSAFEKAYAELDNPTPAPGTKSVIVVETARAPLPAVISAPARRRDTATDAPSISTKGSFADLKLRNDEIFVESKIISLAELTGKPTTSRLSKAIISEGQIVNVVSDNYGFLPNEKFFYEVEAKLIESDIKYVTRQINRENSHFAVDYILTDDSFHIDIKDGGDALTPMLRFTNSYAGGPTSGAFGFFRKVCENGLHVAKSQVGFKIRHKSAIGEIVIPEIGSLVTKFMDNEFYQLKRKFEVLAETPITDLADFVKYTCTKLDLFKFEKSEKNPEPSANAQFVMDLINTEANKVNATEINAWLGYNAFNQVIHDKMKRSFTEQKNLDIHLFDTMLELVQN